MEKIDQILDSLYDRVIEPIEAKEQLLDLFTVMQRSELFFKFIDEYYSHSSENYRNELKKSFTEWNLKNSV